MQSQRLSQVLLIGAFVLSANLVSADDRNLLPKYGSQPRAQWQKAADAKFIAAMDQEYNGDRKKAATAMAERGWQYLTGGNLESAMRRFNQAWLLDGNNGAALWGMAAIQASSGKFDDSFKLFAEAERAVGDDINLSVDFAKTLAMASVQLKDDTLLRKALDRFEQIHRKAPQNAQNLQNWAITLFEKGKYADAWAKVKLAEATPNKAVLDPRFLAALQSRMPRPQN